MDEIKLSIKNQILKCNEALSNKREALYYDGLLSDDLGNLEILLKKITKVFRFCSFISTPFSVAVVAFSMLKFFDLIEFGNMNKAGLAILFLAVFLNSTYKTYKLKVNLEHKIALIRLLHKFERIEN